MDEEAIGQPDFRRPLLSNRDMMVRRGHHITGPRGARDAPRTGVGIRAVSGRRAFCGRFAGPRPVILREPFFRERVGF